MCVSVCVCVCVCVCVKYREGGMRERGRERLSDSVRVCVCLCVRACVCVHARVCKGNTIYNCGVRMVEGGGVRRGEGREGVYLMYYISIY